MFIMESGPDVVNFEYDGVKYAMTEQEIEAAYRYRERQYRLQDAESHLNILVFGVDDGSDFDDPEDEEAKRYFSEDYGISYEEAMSEDMLNEYLRRFENRFDCNYDENSQWEAAIRAVLLDRKENG